MELTNATALVTGANRGVGKEYVAQLIQNGARKVYATARNLQSLEDTVALAPAKVVPLQMDITDLGQINKTAAKASDITLLVNNAGTLTIGGALDLAQAELDRDMAVNNDGTREVTRAFTPAIADNGGGAVVNMLTLLSFVSAPGFAGYNASKAAAWSMSMSLRAYLRPKNIDVVNVFPAGIDTDMLAGIEAPKDAPAAVVRDTLAGLVAGHEDIYPASASEVFNAWRQDPKAVEAAFAEMV